MDQDGYTINNADGRRSSTPKQEDASGYALINYSQDQNMGNKVLPADSLPPTNDVPGAAEGLYSTGELEKDFANQRPSNQQDEQAAASDRELIEQQQENPEERQTVPQDHEDINEVKSDDEKQGAKFDIDEDIESNFNNDDNLMRKYYGVFIVHGPDNKHTFSKMSLFCLSDTNKLRQAFVWLATWNWFDYFVTLAIILNSLMLASTDYEIRLNPDHKSGWTPIQEKIDLVFSIIFIAEAAVKIIAMGFVFSKQSYLFNAWNCLDFFIVCVSIIGLLPFEGGGAESLKALRTFRILRPLRSINKMPAMRKQITSLLGAIPGLTRVFFFIIFIFCIFAIFGTNQFLGQQYQFCRSTEELEIDEKTEKLFWPKLEGPVLCAEDSDCAIAFPDAEIAICGNVFGKAGLDPIEYDGIRDIELIMYGIPGFDNVGQGFLTIFQILTLESWVYLMYNYSDTGNGIISVIFFVLVVLLGAFFTMNLVLAIIVDSFDKRKEEENEKKKEQEAQQDYMINEAPSSVSVIVDQASEGGGNNIRSTPAKEVFYDEPVQRNVEELPSPSLLPEITQKHGQAAALDIAAQERRNLDGGMVFSQGSEHQSQQHEDVKEASKVNTTQYDSSRKKFDDSQQQIQLKKPQEHQENKIVPVLESKEVDGQIMDLVEWEEDDHEKEARSRSKENSFYSCMYKFVSSVAFNFTIFLLIIANTFTLAAYTYDQSDNKTDLLEVFNQFFTWIFFLEMVFKIIGLGFSNYRKDSYNVFDAIIVMISLVDWSISRVPNLDAGSALNAFRALRLLRMMKLSKSWKALKTLLTQMAASLKGIGNFSVLLLLFMYIFALLGMELFANITVYDEDENLIVGEEAVQAKYLSGDFYLFPRDNFNNVGFALTTVFILLIGEDWNWTMYQWVRAYGSDSKIKYNIATLYFVIIMILGNIVLFSVFTAILLEEFDGGDDEGEEEEEEEDEEDEKLENKSGSLNRQLTISQRVMNKETYSDCFESFQLAFGKKKRVENSKNDQGLELYDLESTRKKEELQPDQQLQENVNGSPLQLLQVSQNPFPDNQDDQNHSGEQSEDSVFSDVQPEEHKASPEEIEAMRQKRKRARRIRLAARKKPDALVHYEVSESMMMSSKTISIQQAKSSKAVEVKLLKTSLFCFGPTNAFRKFCYKLQHEDNKWFEYIILTLILISTLTLAIETPLDDPEGDKVMVLEKIDLFMTVVFTFEAIVKIIALGFAFTGKTSYIRNPWNILDFVIVVSALLGAIAGDAIKISFIKSLRILKVLRPLRIIAKRPALKIAIISLGKSIPNIVRLQAIVLFFVFLFSILQTTILSGSFNYCEFGHEFVTAFQQEQNVVTMWDCYNYGGEWVKPDLNYDTVWSSMLTLLTIQSTEGWIDVMWSSVDAVNPYYAPRVNNNLFMIPYTMVVVICICLLFIELFVGVVTETFNSQREILSGNQHLKRSQIVWLQIQLMNLGVKPKKKSSLVGVNRFRADCIILTEHKYFDLFIMGCIVANTFILSFNWYGQPDSYDFPIQLINYTFMAIFTIEAIVKIIAQKLDYFKDSWNQFDFTVVFFTIVILILNWSGVGESVSIFGTILRTLRIGRCFRLIKKQKKLNDIFVTLLEAAPSMGILGTLLMLFIFMFTIIGMSQFATIDLADASEMNNHVNFQTFGAGFLTLIRCSTGEAWNSIMFDSARPYSIMFQCSDKQDYVDIVAAGRDPSDTYGPNGCGGGFAIAFHLLFQVVVSQVFLNLFIAIIIDTFFGQSDLSELPVQPIVMEDFQTIWSTIDQEATGFITMEQLDDLIILLAKADKSEGGSLLGDFRVQILNGVKKMEEEPDLNIEQINQIKAFRNRHIANLKIPTFDNMKKVMFHDVLMRMCHQTINDHLSRDQGRELQKKLANARKFGGESGFTAMLSEGSTKLNRHDVELIDLIKQLKNLKSEKPPDSIVELRAENKELKKKYNHLVDTNLKIIGEANFEKMQSTDHAQIIELYTTKHMVSAQLIYDLIAGSLDPKQQPQRAQSQQQAVVSDLNDVQEVDSRHEITQKEAPFSAVSPEATSLSQDAGRQNQPIGVVLQNAVGTEDQDNDAQ